MFLYGAIFNGFNGWIYLYAIDQITASEVQAAVITSAFFLSFTLGRLFTIYLAVRLTPLKILLISFCGAMLSIILIYSWLQSSIVLWIGTLGLGFFVASIFPTTITYLSQRLRVSGRITSWLLIGGSTGAMFLPWMIGQYYEIRGAVVMVGAVMATILIGLITILIYYVMLAKRVFE